MSQSSIIVKCCLLWTFLVCKKWDDSCPRCNLKAAHKGWKAVGASHSSAYQLPPWTQPVDSAFTVTGTVTHWPMLQFYQWNPHWKSHWLAQKKSLSAVPLTSGKRGNHMVMAVLKDLYAKTSLLFFQMWFGYKITFLCN